MIPKQKQFEVAQRTAAEQALEGLSDTAKVHFAIKVLTGVADPEAAGPLVFAAKRAEEQASLLMREAYERECA